MYQMWPMVLLQMRRCTIQKSFFSEVFLLQIKKLDILIRQFSITNLALVAYL